MLLPELFLILVAWAVGFSAALTPHSPARRSSRHNALQPFQKRASGRFTHFSVGLGACGKQNTDDDFIVALSAASWAGGSHCLQMVTITINGMTTNAQVVDQCMACGPEDLDFSPGLFHHFGGTELQGVMYGTWYYGGEEPTTTTTSKPEPSSTSTHTPPSSTSTPPPSTTSEPHKTSSSSSSPSSSPSSSNAAIPAPTGVLAQSVATNPHGSPHVARRAHDSIARRVPGDVAIHKRFSGAKYTFYDIDVGQVACGGWYKRDDFVVALTALQFGDGYPGPNCGKQVSITYNGKTANAVIVDECMGCPYGGLDFTRGLFDYFADESAGIIYGEWYFVGDTPNTPTTTSTTPTPTPTPTKENPPSTTTPPPPSTTSTSSSSTPSSSSSSNPPTSSSLSTFSSSIDHSSGASTDPAVPTGLTASGNNPHNLLGANQAIIAIGGLIVSGERVS